MKIKWKKMTWWLTVVCLFASSLAFLVVSLKLEKTLFDQLAVIGKAIHEHPERWESIEFTYGSPMLFHKDLYLSTDFTVNAAQLSAFLLLLLIAFLTGTAIHKQIKERHSRRTHSITAFGGSR
ncbi:hypothetical protein [Tichowtungia aerotolerans]|uniref:hypothetical protein n=1 Tax=Tichowtungia aerotolerans TaxID=2697043 RepID=UPI001E2CC855|nr:hypothetical protein [Tichowtungia aerotolerans]